jgi:glycosyltransferase involved in cell wall biosynthesis
MPFPNANAHGIQVAQASTALAQAGKRVTLVVDRIEGTTESAWSLYDHAPPAKLATVQLPLGLLGSRRWQGALFRRLVARLFRRYVLADQPTIIFSRRLEQTRSLARIRRRPGQALVHEVHNISHLVLQEKLERQKRPAAEIQARVTAERRLEEEVYQRVDGIIATSRIAMTHLRQEFGISCPMKVLPNGGPTPDLSPLIPFAGRDIEVLYAGGFAPWKGVDHLIRAMVHLPGRNLHLYGGKKVSQREQLEELVRQCGIEERVHFGERLPHSEMARLYRRTRVGVIPLGGKASLEARLFACPLKLFEMTAWGVPVVATDLPPHRERLLDGAAGLLVPPEEPRRLAEGIGKLLDDEDRAMELAEQARRSADRFTWDARADEQVAFFEELTAV